MKFTISQSSYSVRDAGEIAFGLMVLGVLSLLVAAALGVVIGLPISLLWPKAWYSEAIYPTCIVLSWLVLMWLVIRRYQKVAAQWGEERRGNNMIHLVEWITVGLGLLLSLAAKEGPAESLIIFRSFLAGLMLLLLASHVVTYALLRYRPRLKEVVVWTVLGGAVIIEFSRNTS